MIERFYKFNDTVGDLTFESEVTVGQGHCLLVTRTKDGSRQISGKIDSQAITDLIAFVEEIKAVSAEPNPFPHAKAVVKGKLDAQGESQYSLRLEPRGGYWHLQLLAGGKGVESYPTPPVLEELTAFLAELRSALDGPKAAVEGEHEEAHLLEHRTRISDLGSPE